MAHRIVVAACLVAASALLAACPSGGRGQESRPPESEPTKGVVVTTDTIVECDCPTGSVVSGRRESTNCCELDCATGESTVEIPSDGGNLYRCR